MCCVLNTWMRLWYHVFKRATKGCGDIDITMCMCCVSELCAGGYFKKEKKHTLFRVLEICISFCRGIKRGVK